MDQNPMSLMVWQCERRKWYHWIWSFHNPIFAAFIRGSNQIQEGCDHSFVPILCGQESPYGPLQGHLFISGLGLQTDGRERLTGKLTLLSVWNKWRHLLRHDEPRGFNSAREVTFIYNSVASASSFALATPAPTTLKGWAVWITDWMEYHLHYKT